MNYKKDLVKWFSVFSLKILSIIVVNLSFVWVIVEFFIYLFKDSEFNWYSLITLLISSFVFIVSYAYSGIKLNKMKGKDLISEYKEQNKTTYAKKSRFQQRLDNAMEAQRKNK